MKNLIFRFFLWRIEIKLSKIPNSEERVLYLANKLYSELEHQGYSMHSTDDISGFDVNYYTYMNGSGMSFRVSNIISGWSIKGRKA